MANRRAQGERRPETFDLLGFTHYCRTMRKGRFGMAQADREARQPDPEAHQGRTASPNARMRAWGCRMSWPGCGRLAALPRSADQLPPSLRSLVNRLQRMWVRVLRCRSRKNRLECSKVDLLAKVFRPRLRILHRWPNTRIAVNYLRQELRALAGLRGTAQGGPVQPGSLANTEPQYNLTSRGAVARQILNRWGA